MQKLSLHESEGKDFRKTPEKADTAGPRKIAQWQTASSWLAQFSLFAPKRSSKPVLDVAGVFLAQPFPQPLILFVRGLLLGNAAIPHELLDEFLPVKFLKLVAHSLADELCPGIVVMPGDALINPLQDVLLEFYGHGFHCKTKEDKVLNKASG
jgi:hypothetical protein